MTWAAIRVVVLVMALVAGSSACAMGCSAQPCHDVPPCHQQHGAKVCHHALPDADVAIAIAAAPDMAGIVSELPVVALPELTTLPAPSHSESPPVINVTLFSILRI